MSARLLRVLAFVATSGALVFGLAGRMDLPRVWAYLAVMWGTMLVGTFLLDPEMMRERLKRSQKTADPVVLFLIRALSLGQVVVGTLDVGRLHWADAVPPGVSAVALVVLAAAFGFALTAVRANRFFIPSVRIQTERGHHVVDSGPYRYVRHPGYAGMVVGVPAGGLAMGSWLGFGIGVTAALVFAYRAAREDRFLHDNLAGYRDFAARTRYRLVPGVWVLAMLVAGSSRIGPSTGF